MSLRISVSRDACLTEDSIRVHVDDRGGVRDGTVCWVTANRHSRLLAVRDLHIRGRVDLHLRLQRELLLAENQHHEFGFKPVGRFGEFIWRLTASDPATRVDAWLILGTFLAGTLIGTAGTAIANLP